MVTVLLRPSQVEGSGTFRATRYNIYSSRNGGLENALRAMDLLSVNLGVLQNMKLMGGFLLGTCGDIMCLPLTHPVPDKGG